MSYYFKHRFVIIYTMIDGDKIAMKLPNAILKMNGVKAGDVIGYNTYQKIVLHCDQYQGTFDKLVAREWATERLKHRLN